MFYLIGYNCCICGVECAWTGLVYRFYIKKKWFSELFRIS
jgi:hypothetical protein